MDDGLLRFDISFSSLLFCLFILILLLIWKSMRGMVGGGLKVDKNCVLFPGEWLGEELEERDFVVAFRERDSVIDIWIWRTEGEKVLKAGVLRAGV